MGKYISNYDNMTLEERESPEAPLLDVGTDFRVATIPLANPEKSDEPLSFYEFYKAFDERRRKQRMPVKVALKKIYAQLPHMVHEYFSFHSMMKGYEEFKEGDKNSDLVNPKIASLFLQFQEVSRRDSPVQVFRERFKILKDKKKIPATYMASLLPDGVRDQFKYTTFQNIMYEGCAVKTVSSELGNAILETYLKFPDWDAPVSSDEIFGSFPFGDRYGAMVSFEVALSQIQEALEKNKVERKDAFEDFYVFTGLDPEYNLLTRKDSKQLSIPRLRVAILLRIIEGQPVPQQAIELHNYFLKNRLDGHPATADTPPSGVMFNRTGKIVLETDPAFLEEYRDQLNILKQEKKVPFSAVWDSLPRALLNGHSYLSYRNGSCLGSDKKNLSVPICRAILDVYRRLPDYGASASSDEIAAPFVLREHHGLMMSSEVAYAQIKEARQKHGVKRDFIISRFSELTGYPEDSRLLVKKHGRDTNISRLQVGIILSIIEGKDVPQEAIELLHHYLGKGHATSSVPVFDTEGRLVLKTEQQPETIPPKISGQFNGHDKSNKFVRLLTNASPNSVASAMVMALE